MTVSIEQEFLTLQNWDNFEENYCRLAQSVRRAKWTCSWSNQSRQFSRKQCTVPRGDQLNRTERLVSEWTISRDDAFSNPSATSERKDDLSRPSASQVVPGVAVITRYQCWFQGSFARWRYLSEWRTMMAAKVSKLRLWRTPGTARMVSSATIRSAIMP